MSVSTLRLFLSDQREDINWDAIWYMIGQINYGGRVTDEWDRICLISTLKKCLHPDLLAEGSDKFYYSDSEDYYCLQCVTLEDFEMEIQKVLPNVDHPEVFGLHANANLSYVIQESNRALYCIQMIEPKGSGSSSAEDGTLETIAFFSMLPEPIDKSSVPEHLLGEDPNILPSMSNFLLQEVDKFNAFLGIIRKTLDMLEKAIKGFVPMNEELD